MRTPVIMIFIVCVLVAGVSLLAFYDYKKHGIRTETPNFSKSDGDTLKNVKEEGDVEFQKENYAGAIQKYQRALDMWPRDAHLLNDLGAAYYRWGLKLMEPPMPEDEFSFGAEVDARYEGSKPLEMVKEKLAETKSGIITAVVNKKADRDKIENYIKKSLEQYYIHVEEEDAEYDGKEYWMTIVTGETKEKFLKAEEEYRKAIGVKSVRDSNGRKYSTYASASANLGTLYFRMGKKKDAVANWRRAFQLEPTDELRILIDEYEKK